MSLDTAGSWLLGVAASVFLLTMAGLGAFAWTRGKAGGAAREHFITMDSLLDGSATAGERAAALAFQVAVTSFWLLFVAAGLKLWASGDRVPAILLPGTVGLWLGGILLAQWRDFMRARRKLRRARGARPPEPRS